jgi:hypothetical protein
MMVLLAAVLLQGAPAAAPALPARIRRIVLHVPGGPSYERPERRWMYFSPAETQALWKPSFGTHWILWTDGTLWPRHPCPAEPRAFGLPVGRPLDAEWRRRLAAQAAPVYSHLTGGNSDSLGIEVAHSGRSGSPFPELQVRALAWLLKALVEMSDGRLTAGSIAGHKDLDARPAYVSRHCERQGCPVFVDEAGRAYRRRVDPPESLFAALAREGIALPRPPRGDAELLRAEAQAPGSRPRVMR